MWTAPDHLVDESNERTAWTGNGDLTGGRTPISFAAGILYSPCDSSNRHQMKQEAHEILKRAIAQHREQLLSGKHACLGILWDYGGREHPEVNLLADAVEEHIPDRLLHSQPVTGDIIVCLAESFAAKRLYDSNAAKFAVASWADALGIFQIDPSFFTQPATRTGPGAPPVPEMKRTAEQTTAERAWNLLTSIKWGRKSSTAGDTLRDAALGPHGSRAIVPTRVPAVKRDPDVRKNFANVYWKQKYTLFDLVSDEPIIPIVKDGLTIYQIYYSSEENPVPNYGEFSPEQLEKFLYYKFKNKISCDKFCESRSKR